MTSKINPINDGPLRLEADLDEVNSISYGDRSIGIDENTYLCRCGASKNKPYCDGSHKAISFSSTREITEQPIQTYTGKEITVLFNRSICSGAAACVKGLPGVFHAGGSEHWIHPDEGELEAIVQTIRTCPSGALSFHTSLPVVEESTTVQSIRIVKNGPYLFAGNFALGQTQAPEGGSNKKCALCRCGLSRNKPFCDYSHAEQNWQDAD